ncbi:MAG: TIGR04282 family arsenosugar biosynthesis glycosyltransferase [Desulfobulbaceae bacterium]
MTLRQPPQEEIILFSRYPRAGRVKTRLIPRLGSKGAAGLHAYLTEQALAGAREAAGLRPALLSLWYTGASHQQMTDWLGSALPLLPQQGKDLGERMASAFQAAWTQGVQRVVLIGSDCPGLTPALIVQALAELDRHDLVLGPASDGGYYLIGLRRSVAPEALASLFCDVPWGDATVCRVTLARATAAKLTINTLQELHDIDRPEDLRHLHYHPDPQ